MTKKTDREYALAREYQEELLMGEAVANIEGLLESLEIPRKELANRLGISPGRVSQMLSGERNLTLRTLGAMAWALGAAVDVQLRALEDRSTSPALNDPPIPAWMDSVTSKVREPETAMSEPVALESDEDFFEGWLPPLTAPAPAPERHPGRRRHRTYAEVSPEGEKELAA